MTHDSADLPLWCVSSLLSAVISVFRYRSILFQPKTKDNRNPTKQSHTMSPPTLIRPTYPASLPSRVFSLREGKAYFGARRPIRKGSGMTRSHVLVFEKHSDAKELQRLFMCHRSNMDNWPDSINDSWQMEVQMCHEPYDGKLSIKEEELCDLLQMGLDNICVNVVHGLRMYGGVVEFNTRTVETRFDIQNIRQHFTDVWDRSV